MLFQPVRRAHGDRAEAPHASHQTLESLSGVHLAAGVMLRIWLAMAMAVGRVLARRAFMP